jgi:GT2 family glycosyltransferase
VIGGRWELAPSAVAALRRTPFGRYRIDLERRFADQARGEPLDGDPSRLRVPLLPAANLSLRRDLFWGIGGFDEEFPLAGAEDQDLSLRARAADALLILDTGIHCFHNDRHLSRRAYCERQERSARTMPFLVRKHRAEFEDRPYARENRPVRTGDPPVLVGKKLLKRLLATRPLLDGLHGLARAGEAVRAPELLLRRLYTVLLGLHVFRGFRHSWTQ